MRAIILLAASTLFVAACSHSGMRGGSSAPTAIASFVDSTNRSVGSATLTETASGLKITGSVNGIATGAHGIHLHTVGRCEPRAAAAPRAAALAVFSTAGEHFNPTNKQHGMQNPGGPHAGDLPNITVSGSGAFEITASGLTLAQLLDADGGALVIHAAPDDNRTDPSGNSGERIACGVVTRD